MLGQGLPRRLISLTISGMLIISGFPALALAETGAVLDSTATNVTYPQGVEQLDELGDIAVDAEPLAVDESRDSGLLPEDDSMVSMVDAEHETPSGDGAQVGLAGSTPAEESFIQADDDSQAESNYNPVTDDKLLPQASSGIWGTCNWEIDPNGELHIHAGTGDGSSRPWLYNSSIVVVVFDKGVILPKYCYELFNGCRRLLKVVDNGADTSSVTNTSHMFYECSSLNSLDLSGWDLSSVEDMSSMFQGCSKLTSLDLSSWNTSSVQDMVSLFRDCSSLTSLNLSGWDLSSMQYMYDMFFGCTSLTNLDMSDWALGKTAPEFSGLAQLESIDVSGWDASSVEDMSNLFSGFSSLTSLDLSSWDTSSVTNMHNMFNKCTKLASLDLSGWDTSRVTDMSNMFYGCSSLAFLDLSGMDTSHVTDMSRMFYECYSLATLDLSGWSTSSVTNMSLMFRSCPQLTAIDVSSWDTSSVVDMSCMFRGCASLSDLDLSRWDTSSVKKFGGYDYYYQYDYNFHEGMFSGCDSLTSLDLSSWDTSSAIDMYGMFSRCSSLTSLDLSGWDTSSVTDMRAMFSGCTSLAKIKVGKGYNARLYDDYSFPLPLGSADNKWRSAKDGKLYTRDEIVSSQSGVADTYIAVRLSFPDVAAGSWYEKVVRRAAEIGLTSGYDDGRFGPNDSISRAQVAVILWRMAGQPKAGSGGKAFSDVKAGAYYYNAVRWASSMGVVSGYSDSTFGPNDKVTREQLAVMLANYARRVAKKPVTGSKADFANMKDAEKVASYAQSAVGWCFRNNILSGSGGNVLPKGSATRAQAAKMLVYLYDLLG